MEGLAVELAVKRLVKFDGEGSLKAYVDLAVGESFLIKGLRVVQGKNGVFVSMPRQQGKDGKWYETVSPLDEGTRTGLNELILGAYGSDGE